MEQGFDYHNYDKLEIAVKTDKEKELIKDYSIFGYKVIERYPDKIYSNIAHVIFSRPHKIENKDDLQHLQIYYENYVNNLSELNKNKHSKSALFTFSALVCVLIFIAIGVTLMLTKGLIGIVLGIIVCFISIFVAGKSFLRSKKIRKEEKKIYQAKFDEITTSIKSVLDIAKQLRGG
ncbi:MAG: hypothetical protein E7347_00545 [Clostridiales bacterium]|nr:hypothetical protein [Clostridiales bacterium]